MTIPAHPDSPIEPWQSPYEPVASADDIRQCFRLILGRNPHREEWAGHLGSVGQALPAVVAIYLNSLEFAQRGLLAPRPSGVELADCGDYRIYASPLDEAVGRHALAGGYEPHVTAILRRALRPGMGMLDIGANMGVFALLGAALVGAGGYVLAVEPNPANVRLLEASRRLNGFTQLVVCQAAAGRSIGVLGLHAANSNGVTAPVPAAALLQDAATVCCLPVDALVPADRRIDLIKIDVEGAEYAALSGCQATIRRWQPLIVSEFSPDQMDGVDGPGYLAWLVGLGYRIGVIQADGRLTAPGVAGEPVMAHYAASGADHIDIACLPPGMEPDALA